MINFNQDLEHPNYHQLIQMQSSSQKHLKTLLCQLKPIFKDTTANLQRVSKSLEHYQPSQGIDVVLFPQMAFVGYNFENKEDAIPYAVEPGTGEQFQYCSGLAKKIKAYVIFGYIEKQQKNGEVKLYNSAMVIDRDGKLILNYRKTFLYFCDQLWCEQGNGFKSLVITNTKGETFKCILAICMDINPKDFKSGEYQLADYFVKEKGEVILFITNWVDPQAQSIEDSAVLAMYNYWAHRLTPALSTKQQEKRPFIFLAADRVGPQYSYFDKKETIFFGSSCAIMFNPNYLVQKLNKKDESYLLVDCKLPS